MKAGVAGMAFDGHGINLSDKQPYLQQEKSVGEDVSASRFFSCGCGDYPLFPDVRAALDEAPKTGRFEHRGDHMNGEKRQNRLVFQSA